MESDSDVKEKGTRARTVSSKPTPNGVTNAKAGLMTPKIVEETRTLLKWQETPQKRGRTYIALLLLSQNAQVSA